jgi:SAM-dependent methyltransferase
VDSGRDEPVAAATAPGEEAGRCAACGAEGLVLRHRVAGAAGDQGLIPTTDAFGTALSDIVGCGRCGHGQLAHFPAEGELAQEYREAESGDYVEEETGQRETARGTLQAIERHAPRGRLLELGCWVGFLLAEARDRGWEAVGVEPSEFASSYARERLGLEVVTDDLFDAEIEGDGFDAVVMGDLIEHLIRPGDALDRVAALAPGAVLCLMLPDAGSPLARRMGPRWWSVIPTHVQYFTRRSLATLLRRHGFALLEIGTSPKAFTVRYYLTRIKGYSPTLAGALVRGAQAAGVADRIWAPDFRDRMIALARAPGEAG